MPHLAASAQTRPNYLADTSRSTMTVTLAAIARSIRIILRSPALLVSPIMQSVFFLVVYAGQLTTVGSSYLTGTDFVSFLLPLILLTGVSTGASAAGTLVLDDTKSGYLDRLRLAHGSSTPFIVGAIVAALFAVVIQVTVTILGALLIGYRPDPVAGMFAMCATLLVLGLAIALLSVGVAIRTQSPSTTSLVGLAVFGLSFFTGVFAPVEQLAGWMRAIATVNPLTYIIEAARQFETGSATTSLSLAALFLALLVLAGVVACGMATLHARRNR